MRSIIHYLSSALFGVSVALPHFPLLKEVKGVGMSDFGPYIERLADRLGYINTFYHTEPKLDIMEIPREMEGSLDFVISSDVYEHVLSPVSRAFENTRKLLKPGGVLVLTVPFVAEGTETKEHFPELHKFEIVQERGEYVLKNEAADGRKTERRDLVFHGGPGSTLELRLFCKESLLRELKNAGFRNIAVHSDPFLRHGIYHRDPWSLPITARA